MNRTLRLRREVLTALDPEELSNVVGAFPTSPVRVCLYDVAAVLAIVTFASGCVTCLWCTAPDEGP